MTSHGLRCLLAAGIAVLLTAGLTSPAAADVTLEGTLEVAHSDNFSSKRSQLHYTLKTKKRAIPLDAQNRRSAQRLRRAKNGSKVELTGDRTSKGLDVDSVEVAKARNASAAVAQSGSGRTVAVVMIKFENAEPFSQSAVRNAVFGSASDFFEEQTNGDLNFRGIDDPSGDVFGAYKVPKKDPANQGDKCPSSYWSSQAEQQAAAQHGSLSRYDHVMFIFPTQACGWAGMAGVGWGRSWINGYLETRVIAHELGHNLGVSHANTFRCKQGSKTVSISDNCTTSEYGDPFDIMGSSTRHMNGWHKGRLGALGVFPQMSTQTVVSSGTYTLAPTVPGSPGVQALRIRRSGSGEAKYLYLESRKPFGIYDSGNIGFHPFNGVSVRLAKAYGTNSMIVEQTQLLDATPATSNFGDAPLAVGETFTDDQSNITITNLGRDENYNYTLSITTTGGSAVDPPKNLKASSNYETIGLNWDEIPRNDGATYNIYRDGQQIVAGYPYRTYSDETAQPNRDYQYWVTAVEEGGIESPPSNKVTIRLLDRGGNPPPPPTGGGAAPSVTFSSPTNGEEVSGAVRIIANATDDKGVKRMELYIGGKLSVKRNASSITRNWSTGGKAVKAEPHTITVKAFDADGNQGSASVTVTKK